jgi:hypothetical protein
MSSEMSPVSEPARVASDLEASDIEPDVSPMDIGERFEPVVASYGEDEMMDRLFSDLYPPEEMEMLSYRPSYLDSFLPEEEKESAVNDAMNVGESAVPSDMSLSESTSMSGGSAPSFEELMASAPAVPTRELGAKQLTPYTGGEVSMDMMPSVPTGDGVGAEIGVGAETSGEGLIALAAL